MITKVVTELHRDMLEDAWQLYHGAFRDLNAFAVQRHLMFRDEFDEVMLDQRVRKYMCLDERDELVGLSTYTNDLLAVPLISPEYFERRWPRHYAEQRIWYCGFLAVSPNGRQANTFAELIEAMYTVAVEQNAIIGMDVCRHNDESRRFSRVIRLMLHRMSGEVKAERLDEQSYWLYEFPNAA